MRHTSKIKSVLAGVLLVVPLAFAHYYIARPITNPTSVVGTATLGTPTTSTQWFCVNAAGTVSGGPSATQALAEGPCGTAVAADGVTRYLEERVTTTRPTTQTTSTRRVELLGGTGIRVSDSQASVITQAGPRYYPPAAGGSGSGALEYYGLTCEKYVTAAAGGAGDGSVGSPWTYAQAVSGGASQVVCIASGTYTGTSTASNSVPVFGVPAGSSGDPTVFVCQWAAAYHTTNRCEFRNGVTSGDSGSVTVGLNNDYTTFIGAYVDENVSRSVADTGPVFIGNACTGCRIEGMRVDGITTTRGDNHTGIRMEGCDDCVVTNNLIRNVKETGGSQNAAAILTYSCRTCEISHNDIDGSDVGIFVKGESAGDGEQGNVTVAYNKILNSTLAGISMGGANTTLTLAPNEVVGNLVANAYYGIYFYVFGTSDPDGSSEVNVHHNTFSNIGSSEGALATQDANQNSEAFTDTTWRDNLVVVDGSGVVFNLGWSSANNATIAGRGFTANYNAAYNFTNWGYLSANYSTRAAYYTASGYDQNSTTLTGDPFTNAAGGDYSLNNTAGAGATAKTASSTGGHVGYSGSSSTPGLQ